MRTAKTGKKSVAWGGAVLLAAALAVGSTGAHAGTGPDAESNDPGTAHSAKGAEEVRLDVPTSTAFDPLAGASGAPAQEHSPAGPWKDLPDYPTAGFDQRAGLYYVMGGSDGTTVSDQATRYRADIDEWVDEGPIPAPRQAPAVTNIRDWGMMMAGGWDEDGEPSTIARWHDDASADLPWPEWLPELPEGRAAAGSATGTDGAFFVIGGCTTTECDPVSDSVFVLEGTHDEEWSTVADYPEPVAFPSCDAWQDKIYCTGGHDGDAGTAGSYVYDRDTDTWSALPDPPTDSWGSQHAMVDGTLVVNGGVQDGAITNTTFGYDVQAGEWIDLPSSGSATYRGAGGCLRDPDDDEKSAFRTVGGLDGSDEPVTDAEYLPGFTACGDQFEGSERAPARGR